MRTTTEDSSAADTSMYRGVVYLNNIGCVLLEQGAYQQAMDTMRDAIFVMKTTVCHKTDKNKNPAVNDVPVDPTDVNLEHRMQQAAQRMAFPLRVAVQHATKEQLISLASCHGAPSEEIATISLTDYNQLEIEDMMMFHPDEQMLICPVRIEDDQERVQRNQDLDSATMVLNLGLSHACLARCHTDASTREQLQDAAISIFRLADSILTQQNGHQDCQRTLAAHFDANRVASVHMAVLHSLLQVRLDQQQQSCCLDDEDDDMILDDDCEEVLDRLYYLQNSLMMNDQFDLLQLEGLFPAAAA